MTESIRRLTRWVLLLVGLSTAARAAADETDARGLFASAMAQAQAGHYTEALESFKRAYQLAPHFAVLYNIARIQLALNDTAGALGSLKLYLQTGGSNVPLERRRWSEETIRQLSQGLVSDQHTELPGAAANPRYGGLNVRCPWPDFEVLVDSKPLATSPMATHLSLAEGEHSVAFERPGYVREERSVSVAFGADETISCSPTARTSLPRTIGAELLLHLQPPEAAASLSGNPIPSHALVPAGRHTLVVTAPNYLPQTLHTSIEPQQSLSLTLRLQPITTAPASPQKPAPGRAERRSERAVAADSLRPQRAPYAKLGGVLAAAGLSMGVTAFGIYLWNDRRFDDWEREDLALRTPEAMASPDYEAKRRRHNTTLTSIHRYDTATWASVGLAGLFTVGGAALFFFNPTRDTASVGLAPGGLAYRGVW